jgi:hypothetical protein
MEEDGRAGAGLLLRWRQRTQYLTDKLGSQAVTSPGTVSVFFHLHPGLGSLGQLPENILK